MKNILLTIGLMCLLFIVISCKKEERTVKSKPLNKVIVTKQKIVSEDIVNQIIEKKLNLLKQLKAKPLDANQLYVTFRNHTDSLVVQLEGNEENLLNNYMTFYDEKSKKIGVPDSLKTKIAMFIKAKLEIWEVGEGFSEIRTVPNYYYTIFKDYVSPDYNEYLKLEAEENEVLFDNDAEIIVSWEDVSERVLHWEKFLKSYPDSLLFKNVRDLYQSYLIVYLFGSDNSPVITDEGKNIYPEIKQEFNRFILKNPETNTTKIIRVYFENLPKMERQELYDFIEQEQKQYFIQNKK